tara:strand:- start:3286 stop:3651 length:366 start_codon:yes stop_codon:yes gene_type:complete
MKTIFALYMTSTETAQISSRLSFLRKDQGMTQHEVAAALNVSQSCYAQYETGARKISIDMLPVIAETLNTSIESILGLPEKNGKRGPESRVSKMAEKLTLLPRSKQTVVLDMIESYLDKAS